jgi:hypothetical protein
MPLSERLKKAVEESEQREAERAKLKQQQAEEETNRKALEAEYRRKRDAERLARVEELRPHLEALREDFTQAYLVEVGIAPQELTAQWDRIPEPIKKAMPLSWVGFGLVGGFGAGKTFAIAAALRRHAEKHIDTHLEKLIQAGDPYVLEQALAHKVLNLQPWPRWINWPGEIVKARGMLFTSSQEVEEWILSLTSPERLLILDDIGADRVAGQDWTGETLARIIDERLRYQAMTIWTSNLDAKGLVERYGPRTYSRLQALAPMIQLPKMPDQRLQRGAA